jgi:dUTP pyrophosphatase
MESSLIQLHVKFLTPTATLPARATENASCFDVCADMDGVISPGDRVLVKTGLSVAVPRGFEVQVRSRSGLALKKGVAVLNSPGTVDADYRGEVGVILMNHGHEPFAFKRGDRIAQLGVYRVEMCPAVAVDVLEETSRGAGGFGHTGI